MLGASLMTVLCKEQYVKVYCLTQAYPQRLSAKSVTVLKYEP